VNVLKVILLAKIEAKTEHFRQKTEFLASAHGLIGDDLLGLPTFAIF